MKNTNILALNSVVPKELRLEVYKEALHIIQNDKNVFGLNASLGQLGMCFLFPCILWGLKDINDLTPDEQYWYYWDTKIAFPELTQTIIDTFPCRHSDFKKEQRINYLKSFIKQLES
jgi:hypothetical protein